MIERVFKRITRVLGLEPRERTISLDNYYRGKLQGVIVLESRFGRGVGVYHEETYLSWDEDGKKWRKFYYIGVAEMGGEEDQTVNELGGDFNSDLKNILLIRDEIDDIQHMSPQELETLIRNKIPEADLIVRAQNKLKARSLFPLEKIIATGWR